MKREIIIDELSYVLKDKLNDFLGDIPEKLNDDELNKKFNEYCEQNKTKIKIKDLIDIFQDKSFVLSTPDGFQEIGDFWIKDPKELYKVTTVDDFYTSCSFDHLFESQDGWKYAKNISTQDYLLTKNGFRKVNKIIKYKNKEKVYDFEVIHDNRRYWSGNGISSHNTGKTFLAMSIVRNAQKLGYNVLYLDSEGAIDIEFVKKLGVDTSNFRLQSVNTIEQVNHLISKINEQYKLITDSGETPPKLIIVLDSLGNLSSEKEVTDTVDGSGKRDMTKQQEIRKLFRVNGVQLAKYGIPFIVNAHTYQTMSLFASQEVSGGGGLKYNVSIMFMLGKGKLEDKEVDKKNIEKNIDAVQTGVTVYVKPIKQRFAKPIKVQLHIPFYKSPNPYVGLEKFVNWENGGILRGNIITEKEFNKLSDKEKEKCKRFELDGKEKIAYPKDSARSLVVKHLGQIPLNQLFTPEVFTNKILKDLDEKVIKPIFMLPSAETLEDLEELTEEVGLEEEKIKDKND